MKSKIRKIVVDETDNVDFYFVGSTESFAATEFDRLTRNHLERIEYEIQDYNSEVELMRNG